MSRLRLAAALALSSTLLVGCGGDADSDDTKSGDKKSSASSPDTAAATGEKQTADEFSFSAPEGWTHNDQVAAQAIAFAYDPKDSDGFADNVNVIEDRTLAGVDDLDKIEDGAKASLESAKAEEIQVGDPITLDGEDAATISSVFSLNGAKYRVYQYVVAHGDTGYVVTFSYSLDRPQAEQVEIAESVAASWKWAA